MQENKKPMIKSNFKLKNSQSGQVAIVILLIMVVLLTVGLSLASRTTQELFLSQQESESARVFNSAEVGVEDALSQDFDLIAETKQVKEIRPSTVDQVTTLTTINPNDALETTLVEGAAVHIDLDGYTSDITVDWAREEDCSAASLLVSIYYDDSVSGTEVVHEALGATDGSALCIPSSDFTPIIGGSSPYSFSTTVSLPTAAGETPLFARVRAVYNDTSIRISGAPGFPTQFFTIRSAANTDVGEESRTVEVGRTLSGAPSFMDYSIYSGADIAIESVP